MLATLLEPCGRELAVYLVAVPLPTGHALLTVTIAIDSSVARPQIRFLCVGSIA